MYLFEIYIYNEVEIRMNQDKLTYDLIQAVFHQDDIYHALKWLKTGRFTGRAGKTFTLGVDLLGMRIYSDKESQFLYTDCRGFLLFIEQI